MKRHRVGPIAAGVVLVSLLAACSGSTSPATTSTQSGQAAANDVFTYDTTAAVMVDGWDPATE